MSLELLSSLGIYHICLLETFVTSNDNSKWKILTALTAGYTALARSESNDIHYSSDGFYLFHLPTIQIHSNLT